MSKNKSTSKLSKSKRKNNNVCDDNIDEMNNISQNSSLVMSHKDSSSNMNYTKKNDSNHSKNQNNSFNISIASFDGDPKMLNFFKMQILDLQNINGWSDIKTIMYARSKLAGSALDLFLSNIKLQKSKNITEFFNELENFFSSQTQSNPVVDFENLCFKQDETILQFSLRLDALVNKIYGSLSENDQNLIKFNKFLANVDPSIRLHLLKNKISTYPEALKESIFLSQIREQSSSFSNVHNAKISSINNNDAQNVFTCHNIDVNQPGPSSQNNTGQCEVNNKPSFSKGHNKGCVDKNNKWYKNSKRNFEHSKVYYRNNNNNNRGFSKTKSNNDGHSVHSQRAVSNRQKFNHYRNMAENNPLICQICSKKGHSANSCFKFTNLLKKQNSNNNFSRLNPNASNFRTPYQGNRNNNKFSKNE